MTDVLLVVPPWASAALPVLGPSLLVASLRRAGFVAHVRYSNLAFAAVVGLDRSRRFSRSSSRMHGELAFAEAAWGTPVPPEALEFEGAPGTVTPDDWQAALAAVPDFVAAEARRVVASGASVIGFSSVFQQTVPAVALARAVRSLRPDVTLLLGGANAGGPMARGIADAAPVFDHVVSGDADLLLPELVGRLHAGEAVPRVVEAERVHDLGATPTPEFDDYFEQLAPLVRDGLLPASLPEALPFESSRGCWWGERSHCTFCGLNGLTIAERAHRPERMLADIEALVARWGVTELRASDDLLPLRIQREALPELARRQPGRAEPLRFFYEVKASLKRPTLRTLAAAGVTLVQAGLESLSTDTLRDVGKGTTGPMNLVFLREAGAAGIQVLWNWMVGFPGDDREDYEGALRLLPLIPHLQPPGGLAVVRVDRFSPYHREPERYGIGPLRPLAALAHAWPEGADLHAIAYHFEGAMASPYRDDPALAARVHAGLARWQAAHAAGARLDGVDRPDGGMDVTDSRPGAEAASHVLAPEVAALLRRLEHPTPADVAEGLSPVPAFGGLLQRGLLVQHEGLLLSVVTRRGGADRARSAP